VLAGAGAFGGWIFAGARRSERALADSLDRTATRFSGAATSQIVTAGPAMSGQAAFATRLAGLVAAVALPVAGVGIGTTVDWLRGHEGTSRAADASALEPVVASPGENIALEEAIGRVLALSPKRGIRLALAVPTAAPKAAGDTQRWGWFEQDSSDDGSGGSGNESRGDHWTLQAGVAPVSLEGSQSELRGQGRVLAPEKVLDGSLTATFGTQDSDHPGNPVRFTLEYVESGGRVQPVRILFEGTVVSQQTSQNRTRYEVQGSFRVAGRELGLTRGGRFHGALTPGDTDPSSLQLDISPEG
jgi:hypothetical protein